MAKCHRRDHAVHQASWCHADPATSPIDQARRIEVRHRFEAQQVATAEEATEIGLASSFRGSGDDLHHDRVL